MSAKKVPANLNWPQHSRGDRPPAPIFQGSTIACETYQTQDDAFIDTPGILFRSDTATTRTALAQLQAHDRILLVVKATHVDDDLADLLPLVAGKQGLVVVTFWDKVLPSDFAQQVVGRWEQAAQVKFIPVDARHLSQGQRQQILETLQTPAPFPQQWHPIPAGWRIEPAPTWLEHPRWGGLLAILLLLLPAVIAVWGCQWRRGSARSADPNRVSPDGRCPRAGPLATRGDFDRSLWPSHHGAAVICLGGANGDFVCPYF